MPLTTTPAWRREIVAGAPAWALVLTQADGTRHACVQGERALVISSTLRAAPALLGVRGSAPKLDTFTRGRSGGTAEATTTAAWALAIEGPLGLVGRRVELYLGAEGLPWASWLPRGAYVCRSFRVGTDGTVTLLCVDAIEVAFRSRLRGTWRMATPPTVLSDLIGALPAEVCSPTVPSMDAARTHWQITRAAGSNLGAYTGALYDPGLEPTGEPSTVAQPAASLIGDLVGALGWSLSLADGGQLAVRAPSATVDRVIPVADVKRVGDFDAGEWVTGVRVKYLRSPQESLYQELETSRLRGASELDIGSDRSILWTDANTLADQAFTPLPSWQRERDASWANAAAIVGNGYIVSDPGAPSGRSGTETLSETAVQIVLLDATAGGFCGFRWRNGEFRWGEFTSVAAVGGVVTILNVAMALGRPAFVVGDFIAYAQGGVGAGTPYTIHHAIVISVSGSTVTASTTEADHTISFTGTVWLDQHPDDRGDTRETYIQWDGEVMRVRGLRPVGYSYLGLAIGQGSLVRFGGLDVPRALIVDVERAQLGTIARPHTRRTLVSDVTIAWDMARRAGSRHVRGCPEVPVELHLRHADLVEGDLVSIVDPDLASRWHVPAGGADASVVWEVVQAWPDRDAGCVRATLAWLSQSVGSYVPTPTASLDIASPWVDFGTAPRGSAYWPHNSATYLEGPVAEIEGTEDLTVAMWVRVDRIEGTAHTLIARWGGSDNAWRVEVRADLSLRFYVATSGTDAGTYASTSAAVLTAGAWSLVVAQFVDGAGVPRLFVDGAQVSATVTGTWPSTRRSSARRLTIGADSAGGGNAEETWISAVAVYDKAIPSGTILGLITADGRAAAPALRDESTRPVGWWPLASLLGQLGGDLATESGTSPPDVRFTPEGP